MSSRSRTQQPFKKRDVKPKPDDGRNQAVEAAIRRMRYQNGKPANLAGWGRRRGFTRAFGKR